MANTFAKILGTWHIMSDDNLTANTSVSVTKLNGSTTSIVVGTCSGTYRGQNIYDIIRDETAPVVASNWHGAQRRTNTAANNGGNSNLNF